MATQPEESKMDTRKLGELVGKPYESPEVQSFVKALGPPTVDKEMGAPESIYYLFEAQGVNLLTESTTDRVSTLFLMASQDGEPGYPGPLPYGLSFSMTREQVRQAIRAPDKSKAFYDAWEEGSHILRVEYKDDAITMVIFMGG